MCIGIACSVGIGVVVVVIGCGEVIALLVGVIDVI